MPTDDGVKVTVKVELPLAAIDAGRVMPLTEKLEALVPLIPIVVTVRLALPELLIVYVSEMVAPVV